MVFEETKRWNWEETQEQCESDLTWNDENYLWEESDTDGEEAENEEEQPAAVTEEAQPHQTAVAREGRITRPPSYLNDYVTGNEIFDDEDVVNMAVINSSDPITFEEAEKSINWRKAMDDEINSIVRNQTWELSVLPRGAKCIGVKWIYKTKLNENGEVSKHKA